MESLFILIPLSLVAVVVAVLIFFKMSSGGQFDDDQGPAMSILLDDDSAQVNPEQDQGKRRQHSDEISP